MTHIIAGAGILRVDSALAFRYLWNFGLWLICDLMLTLGLSHQRRPAVAFPIVMTWRQWGLSSATNIHASWAENYQKCLNLSFVTWFHMKAKFTCAQNHSKSLIQKIRIEKSLAIASTLMVQSPLYHCISSVLRPFKWDKSTNERRILDHFCITIGLEGKRWSLPN